MKRKLLAAIAMLLTIIAVAPAHADNAVKLRILVVATGEVAEDLFRRGICLPSSSSLSEEDQLRVITQVREIAVGAQAPMAGSWAR